MSIVKDYLEYTQQWRKEYGDKTLVLLQVGSFFESYSLRNSDGSIYGIDSPSGSNVEEFASINDMIIANKNSLWDGKQVVMAGVGVAYIEKYIKKLQQHDYTVVIYKQDVNGKNTTRSLSEIISPGTFFTQESEELSNNVMCVWIYKSSSNKYTTSQVTIGVSNIDNFTGKTTLFQFSADYNHNPSTYDELERYISVYKPNECLIVANMPEKIITDIIGFVGLQNSKIHKVDITNDIEPSVKNNTLMQSFAKNAEKQIYQKEVFKKFYPHILEEDFFKAFPTHFVASQSFCFLLDFVYQHSPNLVKKLNEPVFENYTDKLVLANHSLHQLNMIDDSRHTGKLRSVGSLLNNCVTTMGKRRFLYNLHNPITNVVKLNESYEITDHLLKKSDVWQKLRSKLIGIKDIEKLHRKMVLNKVTPKDFALLANDLKIIEELYKDTKDDLKLKQYFKDSLLNNTVDFDCNDILTSLTNVFILDKCIHITDINIETEVFITKGISSKIDKLVKESMDSREKLHAIRDYLSNIIKTSEKSSVKDVHYVKIHETPKNDAVLMGTSRRVAILKSQLEKKGKSVEITYFSNFSNKNDKFELNVETIEFNNIGSNKKDLIITNNQIKELASNIQCSRENIVKELGWYFNKYVQDFTIFEHQLNNIIKYITVIDMIQCKCYIANKYNYCKPLIEPQNGKSYLSFTGIRHPLIEHLQTSELYVTNDLELGKADNTSGILMYGTNAVGKTSFIKSIGISLIMAQSGLYVPCHSFTYAPYNYIFTRILGNDNIFKGLSTFAVEMTELRTILKVADEKSLVLGDELCSGTESDSALSIFTAGLEILHEKKSSFLFATHFHEITRYDEIKSLTNMKMMHMAVSYDKSSNKLVYDRKLREGPGESMYGLEVCKSLNLPDDFLQRAHDIRMKYNSRDKNILSLKTSHFNSQKIVGNCELCHNNKASEVHHLQHQQSAKKENDYIDNIEANTNFHKNHIANLINICDKCHKNIHKTGKQHIVKKTTRDFHIVEV